MHGIKAATLITASVLMVGSAAAKPGATRYKPVVPADQRQPARPIQSTQPRAAAPAKAQPTRKPVRASAPASQPRSGPDTGKGSSANSDGSYWDKFHFGATAKVSTLGFGVDLSTPIIQDALNLRVGFNTFSYDYEEEADSDAGGSGDELNYKGDLDFSSLPILFDWHPFKGSFRISAGLILNNNEITASATCATATCEFGDSNISAATLGVTQLTVDLGGTHPYLGIGFGNAVDSDGGFSFGFDLGVIFQDAKVDIQESATCNADPTCRAEAANEEAELKKDADDLKIYPVLSLGVGYKFK